MIVRSVVIVEHISWCGRDCADSGVCCASVMLGGYCEQRLSEYVLAIAGNMGSDSVNRVFIRGVRNPRLALLNQKKASVVEAFF